MKHFRRIRASRRGLRALTAAAALAVATPALGTMVDSPLPELNGEPTTAVFYVTGIQSTADHGEARILDTIFTCTSLEKKDPATFGVEVFTYTGFGPINSYTGALKLNPGQTASISTNDVVGFREADRLDLDTVIPGGSARIISTSNKIMCSALLAHTAAKLDETNFDNPLLAATANLRVVRTSQKGD